MNFKELDDLIHIGVKEVVLESDILLDNGEEFEYREGIKLDVDDLVIDGGGHTIDACGKTRIFLCCSANTIIKDITLKNGFTEESGGAIFNAKDAELRLKDCNFNNNHALSRGGSVENNCDSKLYVAKCNFSKNSAEDGGAISNMKRCHLILKDCCFENNEAMDHGGALHNWLGFMDICSSNFIYNESEYAGAIDNYLGAINIKKSKFKSNNVKKNGGAIFNGGMLESVEECLFENNRCLLRGGAIYTTKSSSNKIFKSRFDSNCAFGRNGLGGAIYNNSNFDNSPLDLFDCEFLKNYSSDGEAIFNNGISNLHHSNIFKIKTSVRKYLLKIEKWWHNLKKRF